MSSPSVASPLVLAIVNARVRTADERRPWADAVLVRGGLIEGVGSSAEIRKRAGATAHVIDARGMLVLAAAESAPLERGSAASLIIVERDAPDDVSTSISAGDIVLRLERGRVVVDRDSLVSPERP